MNQKLDMRLLVITLANLFVCFIVLNWLLPSNLEVSAQEQPPETFLGTLYYGNSIITAIFDHNLPVLSIGGGDNNICTQHNDGSPCNDNPPSGYTYDEHDGIDYSLNYEPILAAANGTVSQAGWSNPTDHRIGLGLRVRINHDNDYRTEYGHLSTINVQSENQIVTNPELGDGIIGISGNTGNVIGANNCDPDIVFTCGAHLHFGLINPSGVRVNPYGWVDPDGVDPWANHEDGAISYNLWINSPAVNTNQYPSGTPIMEPPLPAATIEVDDGNTYLFLDSGGCWSNNGDYHEAETLIVEDINNPESYYCYGKWSFDSDVIAAAGDYDVYVRVPATASPKTLHARYIIRHNGQFDEAVVVQAAYPNNVHDEWAYLGRYDFNLNGRPDSTIGKEYIMISRQTISDTASIGTIVVADAIRLLPASRPPDLEIPIAKSSDDAGNSKFGCLTNSLTDPEVYLGHCANEWPLVSGFRYENVIIPNGAEIDESYLEFTVDGDIDPKTIDIVFQGELSNSPNTFGSNNWPDDRSPLTNAQVLWHIDNTDEWNQAEVRVSPDITPIIQEIMSQVGWSNGDHSIVIIMTPLQIGEDSRRVFAYDRYNNSYQSAKLQIWYAEGSAPTPTPVPTATPAPPPAPTGLTAVYHDGIAHPDSSLSANINLIPTTPIAENPATYVRLNWQRNGAPFGTTFRVYRSATSPVPIDKTHLIAPAVYSSSYRDYGGQLGDWYVITAVNANVTSSPSNEALAAAPCPEC